MGDVARLAGVSVGTVSHVLNHPHRVAPATADRVRRAIEELGFAPDPNAQALAGGTSPMIGFVVIDLANSYFVDMARGAEDAAAEAGMHVLIGNSDLHAERERTYLGLFEEARVAGVLLTPMARGAEPWAGGGTRRELVVLNSAAGGDRCSVVPDDELGGYLAVRHLVECGRRRLAFAAGLLQLAPIARRLAGARRAVEETGGAVTLEVLTVGGLRAQHGRQVGADLLARPAGERPDGVFAAADLIALGIVQALAGTSVSVPDDLAVVGYDDNKEAWGSAVPLTTIAQPGYGIGQAATRLLIEEIRSPGTHEHQHLLLEPTLVERESTRRG